MRPRTHYLPHFNYKVCELGLVGLPAFTLHGHPKHSKKEKSDGITSVNLLPTSLRLGGKRVNPCEHVVNIIISWCAVVKSHDSWWAAVIGMDSCCRGAESKIKNLNQSPSPPLPILYKYSNHPPRPLYFYLLQSECGRNTSRRSCNIRSWQPRKTT